MRSSADILCLRPRRTPIPLYGCDPSLNPFVPGHLGYLFFAALRPTSHAPHFLMGSYELVVYRAPDYLRATIFSAVAGSQRSSVGSIRTCPGSISSRRLSRPASVRRTTSSADSFFPEFAAVAGVSTSGGNSSRTCTPTLAAIRRKLLVNECSPALLAE